MVLANPRPGAEPQDHLAHEAARRTEIDIFERRGIAQLRVAQPPREFPRFTRRPFRVDEQAETVVETQGGVFT